MRTRCGAAALIVNLLRRRRDPPITRGPPSYDPTSFSPHATVREEEVEGANGYEEGEHAREEETLQ